MKRCAGSGIPLGIKTHWGPLPRTLVRRSMVWFRRCSYVAWSMFETEPIHDGTAVDARHGGRRLALAQRVVHRGLPAARG